MVKVVWIVAFLALALWSVLAWGMHALFSGGGDGLTALLSPFIADAMWQQWTGTLLGWAEGAGVVAVWIVWAIGMLVLLGAAAAGTVLVRLSRGAGIGAIADRLRSGGFSQR